MTISRKTRRGGRPDVFRPNIALVLACIVSPLVATLVRPANADDSYVATTIADPGIGIDDLRIVLRPLTKEELTAEADAWMALLRAKALQISQAELGARGMRPPPPPPEAGPGEESPQTAQPQAVDIVQLRTEQTAIVDRLETVLRALKAKGGDVETYKTYINAATGLAATNDARLLWSYVVSWIKSPEGGMRWLKKIGTILAIMLITLMLARFAGRAVNKAIGRQRRTSNLMKQFFIKMAGRTVLVIGALVALGAAGLEIGPMLAALGAGGFILAFALQETLGNLASGLMIMIYRPFDVDDFVDIGGVAGKVKLVSLVSTTLLTGDNRVLVIPNNSVWKGTITNATGSDTRRVDLTFGIGYDDDVSQALEILQTSVTEHPLTLDEPAPTVKLHELADSSVNLICRPWAKTSDYWTVYWDLTQRVKERFDEAGITIPYPQHEVHLHSTATA